MTDVQVISEVIGKKLHRLSIYVDGKFIGEYERSQAADIERKTREIELAIDTLLSVFRTHGEFVVRWNGAAKSIRVDGVQVAVVPQDCWQTPSWG